MGGKTVEQVNAAMAKCIPELASSYAKYPMKHDKWYGANHTGKKGEPCFISSTQNAGLKMDYVWGKGPLGPGYYSLLTKAAYVNLYGRASSEAPGACCCVFSEETRQAIEDWDDVKTLMYNRYVSPTPDDGVAKKAAEGIARQTANDWYQGTQNEQLAVNIVATTANVGGW